jgi:hypothetical protein
MYDICLFYTNRLEAAIGRWGMSDFMNGYYTGCIVTSLMILIIIVVLQ